MPHVGDVGEERGEIKALREIVGTVAEMTIGDDKENVQEHPKGSK